MQHRKKTSAIVKTSLFAAGAWWLTKAALKRHRRIDLQDRNVLITGGSRGLGLLLAREFASRGASIAICARDEGELARAKEDLNERGARVETFPCDLTDADQINGLIEDVESTLGPIDLLVNNAGSIIVGPAQVMMIEDFQQAMDVNFWAAVRTTLAVVPKMKSRGFGRIINIASVGGKMPVPHLAPYCASKFALVGFSTTLRAELSKDGILVTTVNPGLMRTGSPRNADFKGKQKAEYAWFSVSDSVPGMSMSAPSAARKIVNAAIGGEAEVAIGLPAKLASTFYGLCPNLQAEIATLANAALPSADAATSGKKPGRQSESWITRSFLRYFGHRAERNYNQLQT
jgi:short-subunit dehydrogenase